MKRVVEVVSDTPRRTSIARVRLDARGVVGHGNGGDVSRACADGAAIATYAAASSVRVHRVTSPGTWRRLASITIHLRAEVRRLYSAEILAI